MRVDGLARLLDLGHILQRYGITLSVEARPAPDGRSPWLLHALTNDRAPAGDTGALARLTAAFLTAHSRKPR